MTRIEKNGRGNLPQQAPGSSAMSLGSLINSLSNDGGSQEVGSGGSSKLEEVAKGEIGRATNDAEGNALYTPGGTDQPWCADFVNHCVEESGGQGTGSSMAKSFVGGEGLGHVGIKSGSELVGGNQGDAVTAKAMPTDYKWNTMENVSKGIFTAQSGPAPDGAIIVTDRSGGDQSVA